MTPKIFFRSAYNYDTKAASDAAGISNTDPSLTVQSQRDDVDINILMQRYGISGKFPENPRIPEFGDFSEISDFRSALHAVREAEAKFLEFPANTRAFFDNDPQKMLDFAANPVNMEMLRQNMVVNGQSMGITSPSGATGNSGGGGKSPPENPAAGASPAKGA